MVPVAYRNGRPASSVGPGRQVENRHRAAGCRQYRDGPQTSSAMPRATWRSDGKPVLWSVLGTLLPGGILVGLAMFTLPNLVSEWQCGTRRSLSVQAKSVQAKSVRQSLEVNYISSDFTSGSHSATVLADPARPAMLTTDMALDRLWNRTITLVVGSLFMLGLAFAPLPGFVGWLRRRRR
jgi:hypothetical protein